MSKQNKNRPEYKKTKVGWITYELVEIVSLRKEKVNPTEQTTSLKCIELEHLEKGTGRLLGFIEISQQKSLKSRFYIGDVLFGKLRPYLCKYFYCDFEGVCSSEIWVMKSYSNKCIPNYLFYLIHTNNFIKHASVSSGSKMPRSDWNYLKSIPFDIPPLPEQKKISEILSAWDRAIEQVGKLIEAKQKLKKALMQQLLTGKRRFKEFANHETHEKKEKEELPKRWKAKPLGSFGSFFKGKGISNSEKVKTGLPCITYGEIYTKHNFILKEFHSFIDAKTAQTSQRIKKNDVLFAGSGETLNEIGKCVAVTKDIEAYAGGDIIIFRPINVDSVFLSYMLNSDFITRYRRKLGQGHSVVHIYSSGLKTLHIPIPCIPEQKKIAKVLRIYDKEIELLKNKMAKLKEQKKGLMQKLLTGEIRVKT